jgi:nucleotide-binding universal stress UspA family protein
MMATRGGSGLSKQWDLGSVAYRVVHAAKVPIWLVPAELRAEVVLDTLPGRRMVIPLSGTKMAEAVLPHALTLARQRGSESELVLVWADAQAPPRLSAYVRERKRMENYLNRVAESIREAGFAARVEILEGPPAKTIVEFIKKNPTQLVVMAARGHRGLNRMVFGSLTENVIHMIKMTPLLLVTGKG